MRDFFTIRACDALWQEIHLKDDFEGFLLYTYFNNCYSSPVFLDPYQPSARNNLNDLKQPSRDLFRFHADEIMLLSQLLLIPDAIITPEGSGRS